MIFAYRNDPLAFQRPIRVILVSLCREFTFFDLEDIFSLSKLPMSDIDMFSTFCDCSVKLPPVFVIRIVRSELRRYTNQSVLSDHLFCNLVAYNQRCAEDVKPYYTNVTTIMYVSVKCIEVASTELHRFGSPN